MPLTRHGKVDRRALPAPRVGAGRADSGYVAPRTDLEREIAALWTSALGLETIGIHDNFFALGGHSLMATRIAARLAEDLGVDLPLAILFDKPTIAALSEAIAPHRAASAASLEDILAEVEGLSDAEARAHLQA